MADNLEAELAAVVATVRGIEAIAAELASEAQERHRDNAEAMYHALNLIIIECRQTAPNVKWIRICAERALQE